LTDGSTIGREVPLQYTAERDDRLMNSLITKYAREVKNADGQSALFLNKDDAKAVSEEVVNSHKSDIATADVDFDATWNHFDINHDGLVEVERMPQFLRFLTNGALNDQL
jgi:hypothetical protein